MTLLVAPCPAQRKSVSFCCNSSHIAVAVRGLVMVFRAEKSEMVFEFSVEVMDGPTPLLSFNDSPYSDELILAAYSNESITIISCDRREVVFQANTGGAYLVWNPILRSSFYYFSVDRILEHWVVDLGVTPIQARSDWQTEFTSPPIRMVICPMAPASFFVLTMAGIVHHFARSPPENPPRLIRPIVCENKDERIIDIAATNMEFIVIITKHSLALYHIFKFKLVWILNLDPSSVSFMRVLCHSGYPNYIFALMENRHFYALKYSREKKGFEFREYFAFHSFSNNFIRSFSVFGDSFIFFTTDMKLNVVSYDEKRNRFSVVWLYRLPMYSTSVMPCYNAQYLAYVAKSGAMEILNSKTLRYLRTYQYDVPVFGVALLKKWCVFATETDIYMLDLESNVVTKVLSYSEIFSKRSFVRFSDMKTCGNFVFVRLGDHTIVKVEVNEKPSYEHQSFKSITAYDVVSDSKTGFYLFIQTEQGILEMYSSKWQVVCSYEIELTNIAGFVNIQGDVGVFLRTGTIMFGTRNVILCECDKALFAANMLIIQTKEALLCYRYENEFFLVTSWPEKGCQLLSFDGETISYLTQNQNLKTRLITDVPEAQMTRTVNWPWIGFLEKDWLKHTLTILCETLSYVSPVPDDVTEIRFFFDREQEPYRLAPGESQERMFRNVFLCFAGVPLTETQQQMFTECAKSWEADRRLTNAAVMYHFLGQQRKAADCLIEMRNFHLGLCYAMCHDFDDIVHTGILKFAMEKAQRGETVLAASMAMKIHEYHIALHILCESKLYAHMRNLISRTGTIDTTSYTNIVPQIRPLSELIEEMDNAN